MVNWLQKVSQSSLAKMRTVNLPVLRKAQPLVPLNPLAPSQGLPPASIIYGVAASALVVMAAYLLVVGQWFTAFLVLIVAIALLGFALQFIKRQ